jgi:2-polyprenyl-3-methyl-5-hydroxy-6-metoxy-1,4-benzoquinol methylase
MDTLTSSELSDTGERMLPPEDKEISFVFARHHFAYEYARRFVSGKSVVDVGCGTGYGCSLLGKEAARVVGIDRDASAIAYCMQRYSNRNTAFISADADKLPTNETFDVSISFQVIEHLQNPRHFLDELKKITKPGGTVLISTPNSKIAAGRKSDNPFHVSEMSFDEFSKVISSCFANHQILGIGYASKSHFREMILRSPLYSVGRLLKRKSKVKKLASQALGMTKLRLIEKAVAASAIDLMAVCVNE